VLPSMIAACGMNCTLCLGYQRTKNHCFGCRGRIEDRSLSCRQCQISNCHHLVQTKDGFCYQCNNYPCARLKALDKRYRGKYHMSMIENLNQIRDQGMDSFLDQQQQRWTCKACGAVLCVHRDSCPQCHHNLLLPPD